MKFDELYESIMQDKLTNEGLLGKIAKKFRKKKVLDPVGDNIDRLEGIAGGKPGKLPGVAADQRKWDKKSRAQQKRFRALQRDNSKYHSEGDFEMNTPVAPPPSTIDGKPRPEPIQLFPKKIKNEGAFIKALGKLGKRIRPVPDPPPKPLNIKRGDLPAVVRDPDFHRRPL